MALGYEMNTIEFAVRDGVPYAIDFLNPAPDFELERITPLYFEHVLDRMSKLVIDRALHGKPSHVLAPLGRNDRRGRASGIRWHSQGCQAGARR